MTSRPCHVAFLWDQSGDYHMDRAEAVACALGERGRVSIIEITTRSRVYDWPECRPSDQVSRITLFPGKLAEDVGELATAFALNAAIRRAGIDQLFVAGYEHPARFALAVWQALKGRAPVIMLDSKFDDKPRHLRLELLKRFLLMPYRAGFASGARAVAYMRFLGLKRRPIAVGYDTLSIERMRTLAQGVAPPWRERPFLIVARMVPKKNIQTALRAFAAMPRTHRALRICGDGPLRETLAAEIRDLGIADRVVLLGSVSQEVVAREMAGALCLVLPSSEEQWGLVVNEALALGLPIIAGDNVGAKDLLIANYVNGFILNCDDIHAWALAMHALDTDEALWRRFVEGSHDRAHDADSARFADAVLELLGLQGSIP
ncbi:glycosyltransferase [Novosphingobium album (ex Liu et al. 2023)]|uniref:Glycosyltransferase n=1 Tax=Novosphingobium album (ex Liu et al. 2023) TaxID=3031130 RepID=A0ABT5WL81_9SPHN|nr:glycosyltransferase [Novosphingobium album (ex Liu et al. 2023)]MDE8650471.1 glycosyltransferase [Novosphingobium album (ex Liu et al. 2023)]